MFGSLKPLKPRHLSYRAHIVLPFISPISSQAATGEPAGPEAQSAQPVAPQTPTRPEDLTLTEAARLSGPAPTTNLRSDPGIVWGHKVSEGERAGGTLQLGQAGSVAGAAGGLSEGEAARASEGVNQSLTGMEQGAESRPMAEGQVCSAGPI